MKNLKTNSMKQDKLPYDKVPKFIAEIVSESTHDVRFKVRDFELNPTVWTYFDVIDAVNEKAIIDGRDCLNGPIYFIYNYYIPKLYEIELKSDVGSKKLFGVNNVINSFKGIHGFIYSENDTHYLARVCIVNGNNVKEFIADLNYNLSLLKGDNYFIDLNDMKCDNLEQEFCAILTVGIEK